MATLEYTQQCFLQAIFNPKIASVDFIASNYPMERLKVYRATIFENLRNSLALTFPGIWTLLGHDCANSVAYAFANNPENMPKTGCLDDWGNAFPDFLASQLELQHLPYLKDYAQYEWLKHLAYGAAHANTITAENLEKIPEEKIEEIRFLFLPSVFLLTAQFPIHRIQDIIEQPDAPAIDLQHEITTAIIARPKGQILTLFVSQDLGLFFKYLHDGQTLGQATAQTSIPYPDFDLSTAIHLLLKHSLIQEVL